MRKIQSVIMFVVMLTLATTTSAKEANDTIVASQKDVTKWIQEPSVSSSGKQTIHYYAIYKGQLLRTTKTSYEKAKLCTKYGARLPMYVIGQKKNGAFQPKRIIAAQ